MPDNSFFKEEIRSGYLVSEQMKRVWACELDLLQEFLRVCNKYNLKCWADSGTLIGAVRHKGFIPWDDDIDFTMLREDYDKLVAVAEKEFKAPYFFESAHTDFYCSHRHGQLHNAQTAAIPQNYYKRKSCQGIFIDIFILDSYPKSVKAAYKQISKIKYWKSLIKLTRILKKYIPFVFPEKCRWDLYILKKYEDTFRKTKLSDTRYIAYTSLTLREKIKDKSWYEETIYADFENTKIPIPIGYDQLLTIEYGDYMTPKHAPTMHGAMFYDTEKSYTEVLKELRKGKRR